MVGEGCCDCLVDSRQGHAGRAAVNIAQRATSSFARLCAPSGTGPAALPRLACTA